MESEVSYDTIVVGAGAAGAAAAAALARGARRVLLLEAQARVGGRVCTARAPGGVVELGAEWVHGQPSLVSELAARHGVPLAEQPLSFDVFLSDGAPAERALFADLIARGLEAMERGSERDESLGEVVERELVSHAQQYYPSFLADSELWSGFLELMNLLVCNHEASEDWRGVSARSQYAPLPGLQHASWAARGYHTLFDMLLNTYNNGPGLPTLALRLNSEATSIDWSPAGGGVRVTCRGGQRYRADNAIVTVSLGVLKERHASLFTPPLPAAKVAAIDNIAMGTMDKLVVVFTHRWWRAGASFFGFVWRAGERGAVPRALRWTTRVFGASEPRGHPAALTLWTSGEVAREVERLPEAEALAGALSLLRRFLGRDVTVPPPVALLRSQWHSNPYTRGSYSYDALPEEARGEARDHLRAPLRAGAGGAGELRVLFAGEATHPTHFSTVHGACHSGRAAARAVLQQHAPATPASKM